MCRKLALPYIHARYGFKTNILEKVEGPFLLVSNHTTEDDMFFTAAASRQPMYFVCGEHLLRNKVYGRFLRKLLRPIPVPKGASTLPAVRQILKRLNDGQNICMFYEGKRSYHGETIPASESLGALVKKSGCTLVTYHITGGYFTYPRWARGNKRRGHVEGNIAGVYPPSQLAELSAAEITGLINRDTYENAYESQRENKWEYKGKNLAKGMETVLFLCPECGSEDTIETDGNRFYCTKCSLSGEYNEYGFLEGENLPYDNVLDWMRWIEKEFDRRLALCSEDTPVYDCSNVTFYRMNEDYTNSTLCESSLHIYKSKIEIDGHSFDFDDIPYMSVLYGNILLFTFNGDRYGLSGESFKAWKCARLWHIKKGSSNDRTKEI